MDIMEIIKNDMNIYIDDSANNGGRTSYYDINSKWNGFNNMFDELNFNVSEVFIFVKLCDYAFNNDIQILKAINKTVNIIKLKENKYEFTKMEEGVIADHETLMRLLIGSNPNDSVNEVYASANKVLIELILSIDLVYNRKKIDTKPGIKRFKNANDIMDYFDMHVNVGEAFKVAFCFNTGRHEGTNTIRDLNKISYYCKQEFSRYPDCDECPDEE